MNEVDNHYGAAEGSPRPNSTASAGPARSAIDQAVSSARSTLHDATDAVKDGVSSARRAAGDAYDRASHTASDYYDTASRNAVYARRRTALELGRGRRNVETFVEQNPVAIGVAGVAIGLLIGTLLPNTRRENRLFGRYADEVRDQGARYVKDVADQSRHFVDDSLRQAGATLSGSRRG